MFYDQLSFMLLLVAIFLNSIVSLVAKESLEEEKEIINQINSSSQASANSKLLSNFLGFHLADKLKNPQDELLNDFLDNLETWNQALEQYTELGNDLYHKCLEDLTPVLGRKRAKESARFFKTYNSQIQADVTFNMRSFANFIKLRNS